MELPNKIRIYPIFYLLKGDYTPVAQQLRAVRIAWVKFFESIVNLSQRTRIRAMQALAIV